MTDISFDEVRQQIFDCEVIKEDTVMRLLIMLSKLLMEQSNLIYLSSPIVICGDIHGQMHDLVKLFQVTHGFDSEKKWTNKKKYLFMGNYIDFGYYSLNTYLLLVTLKLQYPDQITLLRGNHECRRISKEYGLYEEIVNNYGHQGIFNFVNETFDLLPIAAVVDNEIFCVHGGISSNVFLIERINILNRQGETPREGPIAELLWNDPDETIADFAKGQRESGIIFGMKPCVKFLRLNRLKMVCRSNQVEMSGYKKYFGKSGGNPDWRLISIFSAPDFKCRTGNLASVMHVNDIEDEFKGDGCPYYLNVFDQSQERKNPSDE